MCLLVQTPSRCSWVCSGERCLRIWLVCSSYFIIVSVVLGLRRRYILFRSLTVLHHFLFVLSCLLVITCEASLPPSLRYSRRERVTHIHTIKFAAALLSCLLVSLSISFPSPFVFFFLHCERFRSQLLCCSIY